MLSQKILWTVLSVAVITMGSEPAQANIHNPYVQQMSRTYQRLTQTFLPNDQEEDDADRVSLGSGHFWSATSPDEIIDLIDSETNLAPELDDIRSGSLVTPGLNGPAVGDIAKMLVDVGYPVEHSDYYGREMVWQVSRFQQDHHLAALDSPYLGIIGASTLELLEAQFSQGQYNAELGQKLAAYARSHVSGTKWNCYRYVAHAIHANLDSFLQGMHAYMAADYLAQNKHFKEIQVSVSELPDLPAGAVVVWGKGSSRSGHISIADGQGKEISDHVSPQMLAHYGGAAPRVFLPVKAKS